MSLNLANFPLIGVTTEHPTREHYRREGAMWRKRALDLESGRKGGQRGRDFLHAARMADRFEAIALRLPPEEQRNAA